MVNNNLYNIPRSEELIKKAKEKDAWGNPVKLTQAELLALKSRSFAIPIAQLRYCKGDKEVPKEEEITILYNSLRELDCIEDGRLFLDQKLEAIDELIHIYNEVERHEVDLEELIQNDLRNLTDCIRVGAVDEEEKVFIEQFGYGDTLRVLRGFKSYGLRNRIINCINKMGSGMKDFLRKGRLETMDDFNAYRFYVAEHVGETLNGIVHLKDEIKGLESYLARSIGGYLQSTNILKNLREDFEERRTRTKFIPENLHRGISYEDLFEKDDEKTKEVRKLILDQILVDTKENLESSIEYVIKIPTSPIHPSGYEAFVLTPLITAEKTLDLMERAGAERVFRGDKDAVKVSHDVFANISRFVGGIVRLDYGVRVKEWELKYQHNPKKFSFEPGEYEKWSPNWLTDKYFEVD